MIKRIGGASLSGPLAIIIRKSLDESVLPQAWSDANVTCIFKKKGSRAKKEFYRGVSVSNIFGKVVEKVIRKSILDHLQEHGMVSKNQFGMYKNRSVGQNLVNYLDYIAKQNDAGRTVVSLMTDYTRYFDLVQHKKLVALLEKRYSIQGKLLQWIKEWLGMRRQRVVIEGAHGEWKKVDVGVFQGSVLGVLWGVLFGDPIDQVVKHGNLSRFIDDNKYYGIIQSNEDVARFQEDIDRIADWADSFGIQMNSTKCCYIVFGKFAERSGVNIQFYMRGLYLQRKNMEKDLGLMVEEKLSRECFWKKQALKATQMGKLILANFLSRDQEVLVKLYKIYVRVFLEGQYAVALLPFRKKHRHLLERVQQNFLRRMKGMGEISSEERLKRLGLQPISIRHLRAMAIEVHKKLAGLSALDDGLVSRIAHSRTRAGSRGDLLLPATRKDNFKYSFTAVGPRVFNLLSVETRNAESTSEFKRGFDSDVTDLELC